MRPQHSLACGLDLRHGTRQTSSARRSASSRKMSLLHDIRATNSPQDPRKDPFRQNAQRRLPEHRTAQKHEPHRQRAVPSPLTGEKLKKAKWAAFASPSMQGIVSSASGPRIGGADPFGAWPQVGFHSFRKRRVPNQPPPQGEIDTGTQRFTRLCFAAGAREAARLEAPR